MKRMRLSVALILLIVVTMSAINLFAQEADSTHYPNTACLRWSLITTDDERGIGDWKENDDQFSYERPDWDNPKTEFLRRFDVLKVGAIHIMSFEDTYQNSDDYFIRGKSLAHNHFGQTYDHDENHGGSQQDLLAKAKWTERRYGLPQILLGSFDIFKVENNYLRNPIDSTNPSAASVKRELSDWIPPGWFA